ncbi:Signal recognition particle 54 kDa protein [uncultured archaeon]|nr:Signal recognition particle 54 kDa protein [uncultured archaeon]
MLDKIKDALSKFARIGVADKNSVDELVKELQRTLIQADVDVKLVFELSKRIKDEALDEKIPKGLTRREHVINIVHKELTQFLGEKAPQIELKKQKILLVGLFGSGKTTSSAKLAKFYLKKGLTVGLISCDTWRPAAYEQLKQLGDKIGVEVYGNPKEKKASKIVKDGLKQFADKKVIIIDSAGRSALDDDLRKELEEVDKAAGADEKLLVLSGDIGQAAKKQAEEFNKITGLTGVILTKMDSSAKGGGALSACFASGINVKFIGTGEKIDDFEVYDPVRFVGRLLGMGDLQALLERAREAIEPEKAADFIKGEFSLQDFFGQIESVSKMGSFSKILEMIPGMSSIKLPKEALDVQEAKMKKWKYIMQSMTKEEKQNPDVIDSSRVQRIAKGSGTRPEEVKELIKSYNQTKKMVKKMQGGKMLKRGPMAGMMKGMGI